VVLADPGLVEAEVLDLLHQLDVALQRESGVLAGWVVRRDEHAEAQRG
jgi:hypothetical protein